MNELLVITGLIFIFGLIFGSFLNVVIYRTTHHQSPLEGRSKCPNCGKLINWKHNIPLISFFILRGKCADCGKRISWQYPVVEFLTGFLFVWWFFIGRGFFMLAEKPWTLVQPVFWLIVGMCLLVIFMADLIYGLIPDSVNVILFSAVLIYRLALVFSGQMKSIDFSYSIVCGFVLFGFFYSLWYFTKGKGFGYGDVKMAPAIGLLLGWPRTLVGVILAFILGAAVAVILILGGRKKMKQTVPFGPFLVIGLLFALLWGLPIWNWYMAML